MQPPVLRFAASGTVTDFPLEVGMHHVGWVDGNVPGLVAAGAQALVCFCVDRRGVWLTVSDGRVGVHVNGRSVRRLAMLRPGDTVHVDGHEMRLVAAHPSGTLDAGAQGRGGMHAEEMLVHDPRVVLRGIGGSYHGRSFTLATPRLVGRAPEADIRIDDPAFPARHARVELIDGQVHLRGLDTEECSVVNGESVHDALLLPGDQVVFDAHHRFVVEAPAHRGARPCAASYALGRVLDDAEGHVSGAVPVDEDASTGGEDARSPWRLPWLLLAAMLIAGLLALLLLYGAG